MIAASTRCLSHGCKSPSVRCARDGTKNLCSALSLKLFPQPSGCLNWHTAGLVERFWHSVSPKRRLQKTLVTHRKPLATNSRRSVKICLKYEDTLANCYAKQVEKKRKHGLNTDTKASTDPQNRHSHLNSHLQVNRHQSLQGIHTHQILKLTRYSGKPQFQKQFRTLSLDARTLGHSLLKLTTFHLQDAPHWPSANMARL